MALRQSIVKDTCNPLYASENNLRFENYELGIDTDEE